MDLKTFLEEVAPYTKEKIEGIVFEKITSVGSATGFREYGKLIDVPEINVFCNSPKCKGFRIFKPNYGTEKLKTKQEILNYLIFVKTVLQAAKSM